MSFIISIAMSQRTPSHWAAIEPSVSITAARRSGENAFSCTTSGQAGKYGSRPLASTPPPTRDERGRVALEVLLAAAHEVLGVRLRPRVVGRDVVRHEVEDQPDPALGERRARRREARRPAQVGVDRVAADAVRRADDVLGAEVGQRAPEALDEPLVLERDRDPGRAALPDAHQPDRVEAELRDRVPLGLGHAARSIAVPSRRLSSSSQTQVLIS